MTEPRTARRALRTGAGVLALLALGYAWLSFRDGRTASRAREVERRIQVFCDENGRLPDAHEFARLFPDLTTQAEWYYWPARDGSQAHVQYPMTWTRRGVPGTPKTSEFTATIYAYVITVRCGAWDASPH